MFCARRIRCEKLREHQYRGEYVRWEQVKWAMVESAREVWLNESGRKEPEEFVIEQ